MRIISINLTRYIKMNRLSLACIFMIAILTGACATGTKKQTMSETNITGQETAYSNLTGDNEIECRRRIATGSLFKSKVCLTKAAWAIVDEKNKKRTDRFERDADRKTSINPVSERDSMGGMTSGMPR